MGYYSTPMKRWTLESPGAGIVLHLLLFSLVVAAVQYSEHRAASIPAAAPSPPQTRPEPMRAQQHARDPVRQAVPVAEAALPRHPAP